MHIGIARLGKLGLGCSVELVVIFVAIQLPVHVMHMYA